MALWRLIVKLAFVLCVVGTLFLVALVNNNDISRGNGQAGHLSLHSLLDLNVAKQSAMQVDYSYEDKKMTRETIGRMTWHLFHTMAAKFPEHPTPEQSKTACDFFNSMPILYPCKECAAHFRLLLEALPCRAGSRAELTQWACDAHNEVNKRLSKPIFDCSKLTDVWGHAFEGECGCHKGGSSDSSQHGSSTVQDITPALVSADSVPSGVATSLVAGPSASGSG